MPIFRQSGDHSIREEVIILLTVRVVKGELEEKEAEAQLDQIERMRVGMPRGITPLARERMGQAHYQWALEHLATGELSKADWDAQLATHYSPRCVPAIQLHEQIRSQRIWDEDQSSRRSCHRSRCIAR